MKNEVKTFSNLPTDILQEVTKLPDDIKQAEIYNDEEERKEKEELRQEQRERPEPEPEPQTAPPEDENFELPKQRVNLSFIPAEAGITVIDNVIPYLLIILLKMIGIKGADKKALQLTASEKTTLQPIVAECLKRIYIDFSNPFIALGIVAGSIYLTKAGLLGVDLWEEQKKETPETPPENKQGRGRPRKKY